MLAVATGSKARGVWNGVVPNDIFLNVLIHGFMYGEKRSEIPG